MTNKIRNCGDVHIWTLGFHEAGIATQGMRFSRVDAMQPPVGSTIELCSTSDMEHSVTFGATTKKAKVLKIVALISGVFVLMVAAFLIGYFVSSRKHVTECDDENTPKVKVASFMKYHKQFQDKISAEKLEENLRYFSKKPHMAGSARQLELAEDLASRWREYKFDDVQMPEYNVLLSVPQEDKPNRVTVINNGSVEMIIPCQIEVAAGPNSSSMFNYTTYFAYSPNGTADGQLVYANQGSPFDLKELDIRSISLKGKIVLIRGSWVRSIMDRGAAGVLCFNDPITHSKKGPQANETYPNTEWMSQDAVYERPLGSMFGDLRTPGLPAVDGMYRRAKNVSLSSTPTIPVQPISYKYARLLLSRLEGEEVPQSWRGTMNVTYRFGPGFKHSNATVRLEVYSQNVMKKIYNVIGTIRGTEEPDRLVLIGNHRDAWLFGAVDPSSGTACLAEISRVVGELLKSGWRPRRTLKFCSWGAEEFGLIGSVEWVEEHRQLLMDRAVAYLNTDVAVGGNYVMMTQTCPSLTNAIFDFAKKIKDPNAHGNKQSLFDIMVDRAPSPVNGSEPDVIPYLYFSDYLPFYMYAGVPSADFSYFFGRRILYPVYHTQEDTFYWMKTFVDPKFKFHETVAKFEGGLLLELTDTPILPLSVSRMRYDLNQTCHDLVVKMAKLKIDTSHVTRALNRFVNASTLFECAMKELSSDDDPMTLRMFNDQMLRVEKAFLNSAVLSTQPSERHVIARGKANGVYLAIKQGNMEEAKRQLSVVALAINTAAEIIQPIKTR